MIFLEILVDVGGEPGKDCNGFCNYCYFKGVKDVEPLGCKYCLPFKKGCSYCDRGIRESGIPFKHIQTVLNETFSRIANLRQLGKSNENPEAFIITGGGDVSCYPEFENLISFLAEMGLPIKIGYTSGKGLNENSADFLIKNNVTEINFTLFSSDPALRKKHMHDPHPELSIEIFSKLCKKCDVYAAIVLIPGINDGEVLENTLKFVNDAKAKGVLLMRFANSFENGLILKNEPVMKGIVPHSIEEFREIVKEAAKKYPELRITGTPLDDPKIDSPFVIRNKPEYLSKLPKIRKTATIITGNAAAPRLSQIFKSLGNAVNVVAVKKDVGCLITIEDLLELDLSEVSETVFIPGRAFVHDREAKEALTRDGIDRIVRRGPETLSTDSEISASMTQEEVISHEMKEFSELIEHINSIGMPIENND